ncbi:hypothetical protein [Sphingomonas turrisvirgatae]|uniref:Uncharacterized protein n=1 Tax=Sphingomonas turrisvirgatae TaxID=1888892 RepID=A0A1E3M259_9SPHN|nr:hypothetical protein [Sphingomonas turrisvirgatae]ODP39455.1 hypothetical protein BFL28_10305 [Sphingomonas turrisvirgatae]
MERELALWTDALAFADSHGGEGPDAIARKIDDLRTRERVEEAAWWLSVGRRLTRLYQMHAAPPN